MAWRFLDDEPMYGPYYNLPRAQQPRCGDRLVHGSHVACCLRPEHDGPHESDDGEQWEDVLHPPATREPRFPAPGNRPAKPVKPRRSRPRGNPRSWGQR